MLHACLAASLPAPIGYYRAMVRPLAAASMIKKLAGMLSTPLLQLHGAQDEWSMSRLSLGPPVPLLTRYAVSS